MTLPSVQAEGTLTGDPPIRFTANGTAVTNFTLACNDRVKDAATGQWTDGDATFLRVVVWGKLAEHIVDSVVKGDRCMVIGKLKQSTYTQQDGTERTSLEVTADSVGPAVTFGSAPSSKKTGVAGPATQGAPSGRPANPDPWGAPAGAAQPYEPPF